MLFILEVFPGRVKQKDKTRKKRECLAKTFKIFKLCLHLFLLVLI